jgi:hypothetical protein
MAVALTANTPLAPKRYEQQLLARYQTGELTIDEVLAQLERSTYHVLYHSRATQAPTDADLQALLAQARTYNVPRSLPGSRFIATSGLCSCLKDPKLWCVPSTPSFRRTRATGRS